MILYSKVPCCIIAVTWLLMAFAGRAAEVYTEPRVRNLIADMTPGGSPACYKQHANDAVPAVAPKEWAVGARLVSTNHFERRRIKTLITRKGSNERISGMQVKLSID